VNNTISFLIVAVVTSAVSLLLLRLGVAGLKPSRLVPVKSMSQISSLFGGLSRGRERLDLE
jgi:hypothetical protein